MNFNTTKKLKAVSQLLVPVCAELVSLQWSSLRLHPQPCKHKHNYLSTDSWKTAASSLFRYLTSQSEITAEA